MIKDYHNLYLKCYGLLLADVFEKFRNSILKIFGLYSRCYLRAPALSWDAVLRMAKNELELMSDADMYLYFEEGMRGGVPYISKRYSKANNQYLKSYNPKQESKHSLYLDANNLYGYVMFKFLPICGFKWIDPKDVGLNEYSSKKLCSRS